MLPVGESLAYPIASRVGQQLVELPVAVRGFDDHRGVVSEQLGAEVVEPLGLANAEEAALVAMSVPVTNGFDRRLS